MAKKTNHDYSSDGIPELGVTEHWQALFLPPSDYVDRSLLITRFRDLDPRANRALVRAEVAHIARLGRDGQPTQSPYPARWTFTLSDGVGLIECDAFGGSEWRSVDVGNQLTLLVQIKSSTFRNGLYFVSPERAEHSPVPRVDYTGIPGSVSGHVIGYYAQAAAKDAANITKAAQWLRAERPVVARLVQKHWGSIETLLRTLHQPETVAAGKKALVFVKRLCKAEIRYRARIAAHNPQPITPFQQLRNLVWQAWQSQPETPSPGQLDALRTAVPALSGDKPGRVLINGDVGTGKTLVFLTVVAGFALDNRPCAIMAPSETLAQQLHQQVRTRFPNIPCKYIAASATPSADPALVWIGTTSLLSASDRPEFACVVIDEQHKFSRAQREALLSPDTHLIEASATPIPRSLALALFDGFALANLGAPPVNKRIRSHLITDEQRSEVTALYHAAVENGQRVIYLYAAVKEKRQHSTTEGSAIALEQQSKDNLRAANAAYASLNAVFPDKVALLHGQMPVAKASAELDAFRQSVKPILVASTSVEVGVDVPDVRLMVVNNCENFGIAQLHQLRGRLARNGGEADFVMHTRKKLTKEALKRLHAVRDTQDGFRLAERDMEIRGFGEVAGDMQTGAMATTFKLCRMSAKDFIA